MKQQLHHSLPVMLFVLLMCTLGMVGCTAMPDGPDPEPKSVSSKDGVLIHLHSGSQNPNAALMGLTMAKNFSGTNPVIVYCDLEAISLLEKDSPNLTNNAYGSSHKLINELLDKKVAIYACPSCMRLHNKTSDDLIPRVQTANKTALFGFTTGRIITLDY